MVHRDWQNFISKHTGLISGGVALLRLERKGVLILPAYGIINCHIFSGFRH